MDGVAHVARPNRVKKAPASLWVLLAIAAGTLPGAGDAAAQATYYDRSEVPGHYTLGLYPKADGTGDKVVLDGDDDVFEAFLGVTGDSTQVFSGLVFGLEVPEGIELDGAIRWNAIPGLTQWGSPFEEGVRVEFNKDCQAQTTATPVVVGRVQFNVDENFQGGEIVVRGHRRWGVSVELCDPARDWPKPFADPVNLTVERKRSFWSKLQDMFK
jgi:hypothetical protein